MVRVLESLPVLGDLLKMELDAKYCREGAYVASDNVIGDDVPESILGYPVSVAVVGGKKMVTFLLAAGIANATGLVLYQGRVNGGLEGLPQHGLAILTRGPAIVNRAAIPTVDYAGDPFNLDTLVGVLEDRGIITLDEPPETTVHTT